jgi:hypothetical protein
MVAKGNPKAVAGIVGTGRTPTVISRYPATKVAEHVYTKCVKARPDERSLKRSNSAPLTPDPVALLQSR